MMKLKVAGCVLGLTLLTMPSMVQAQPYELTLAGASPGGLWSLLGVGADRAVKAAYPGSTVTYQTSGGGIANVQLVEQKKVPLGIVHNMELRMALNGEAPFKAPVKDVRVLANLYNWAPIQLIVTKEFADKHGIKTFEDIAAKKPPLRVALNRRGNIAHDLVDRMFKAAGITQDDIQKWGGTVVLAASEEQGDLIRNRRVDAIFNSLFVGQRSLIEVGQSISVIVLPAGEKTISKVAEETGVGAFVIPANSYAFQPNAVPTVSLGAMLVANSAMSEQEAYNLTKALVEHLPQIQAVHPSMKSLTPQLMAKPSAGTIHPGAAKYFKEKGLL